MSIDTIEHITTKQDTENNLDRYKYYIHDAIVGQIRIKEKKYTLALAGLSTINFQTKNLLSSNLADLETFNTDKKLYNNSRKILQENEIRTDGIGTYILLDMINKAKKSKKIFIEGDIIQSARFFYEKVCKKFKEQGYIENYSISGQNQLLIYIGKNN